MLRRRDDETVKTLATLSPLEYNKEMDRVVQESGSYDSNFAESKKGQDRMRQLLKAGLMNGRYDDYVKDWAVKKAQDISDPEDKKKYVEMETDSNGQPVKDEQGNTKYKGLLNRTTNEAFMAQYVDKDPAMLRDIDDMSINSGRFENIGREETDPKKREAKIISNLRAMDKEKLGKINPALLSDDAQKAFMEKLKGEEDFTPTRKQIKAWYAPRFDSETGVPVFDNDTQYQRFVKFRTENPEVMQRVIDASINATREDDRFVDGKIPGAWIFNPATETTPAVWERKDPDGIMPIGKEPRGKLFEVKNKPKSGYKNRAVGILTLVRMQLARLQNQHQQF